jgi:hypothetical protein
MAKKAKSVKTTAKKTTAKKTIQQGDFLAHLSARVDHYENTYALQRKGQAFLMWYAVESLGLEPDDAFEAVSVEGGNDKGIDFFHIDQDHQRIILAQGKYQANGKYKAKQGELYELLHAPDWLKDPPALEKEGRPDLADDAEEFMEAIDNGFGVEFIYAYCGPRHKETIDVANKFNEDEGESSPSVFARIAGLPELLGEYRERVEETRIAEAVIRVPVGTSFEVTGTFGRSLVVSIPGTELKQLYETHSERLFDRNIRLFLGTRKGGVNAGMQDTLASAQERRNFWSYNNGITLVCDSFDIDSDSGDLTLKNFSIVNGCQTTVSIGKASPSAAKEISVLGRFINSSEAITDNIIRYNNSQNPIRVWEFSSQDPIQKRLKKELAEEPKPFFYALRKGEARFLSPDEKEHYKRDGSVQQIPHDTVTQYLASMDGYPTVAYKDKGRLFNAMRAQLYPDNIRVEKVILAWQLGRVVEDVVKEAIREARKNGEDNDLRILRRGARMFVIAVTGVILRSRNGSTYIEKLKREVASSKATAGRLSQYSEVGVAWYVQAVRDLLDGGEDLSTLTRSEASYDRVRKKVETSWKTFSVSKQWVEGALPAL